MSPMALEQHEANVRQLAGERPPPPPDPWPTLDGLARHGLAGDVVDAVEPVSEADPVAVLVQFLAAFGNACNRGAYFTVESATHHQNLNVLLVGQSSRGRKGTSWKQVLRLFQEADADWARTRVLSGLSSGEGLIWSVRDPIYRQAAVREGKQVVRYEQQLEDAGVEDKRLCALAEEFGSLLRVMKRESNTLSAVLRQAWDGVDLRVLTKVTPAVATNPHVSVIGHVTQDELKRELDRVELMNGFLNRFLIVCARRSKELPEGGQVNGTAFRRLAGDLRLALDHGRTVGELRRDEAARAYWPTMYSQLTADRPGMLGAATARAEAQVARLAMIYAVLDLASEIRVSHLDAAFALWKYCEGSALYLFGQSTGDPLADEMLRALTDAGAAGLTRTQITGDVFRGNRSKVELDRALTTLERAGLARAERVAHGRGRPAERWISSSRSFLSSPQVDSEEEGDTPDSAIQTYEINEVRDSVRTLGSVLADEERSISEAGPGLEDIPPDWLPPGGEGE
ncbi:MAG: DUF3987 domain-containing protein [Gemmatimonadales bacterium]